MISLPTPADKIVSEFADKICQIEPQFIDDGTYRSSAYFSILESEWVTVKKKLEEKISVLLNT